VALSRAREAVVCGDTRLNYADLDAATNRVANLLVTAGIQPGDRVALSCTNIPQFPIIYYGILKGRRGRRPDERAAQSARDRLPPDGFVGQGVLLLRGRPGLPLGEEGRAGFDQAPECTHFFPVTTALEGFLADASPSSSPSRVPRPTPRHPLHQRHDRHPERRRADPREHGAQRAHLSRLFGTVDDEVHLSRCRCSTPSARRPAQLGFRRGRHPRAAAQVHAGRRAGHHGERAVTFFAGVPTMYWALAGAADTVDVKAIAGNLRIAVSGGAALPVEIHEQIRRGYGVEIREGYGLSETSPITTFNHPAGR